MSSAKASGDHKTQTGLRLSVSVFASAAERRCLKADGCTHRRCCWRC